MIKQINMLQFKLPTFLSIRGQWDINKVFHLVWMKVSWRVPISILWFLPVKILHVFLIKSKVMMVCLHNWHCKQMSKSKQFYSKETCEVSWIHFAKTFLMHMLADSQWGRGHSQHSPLVVNNIKMNCFAFSASFSSLNYSYIPSKFKASRLPAPLSFFSALLPLIPLFP